MFCLSDGSAVVYSGVDVFQQSKVVLVCRLHLERLADRQLSIEIVLLDEQTYCQVVLCLIVTVVQSKCLLVIVNGFLVYRYAEVSVP